MRPTLAEKWKSRSALGRLGVAASNVGPTIASGGSTTAASPSARTFPTLVDPPGQEKIWKAEAFMNETWCVMYDTAPHTLHAILALAAVDTFFFPARARNINTGQIVIL